MLQFQGRNITSEFDLLRVKVQAIDFIKPIKFQNSDLEKLADLVFELAKELIFNQVDAYLCLNCYKLERKIGLEVYVYNKNMSLEKAQEALNNNCNLSKKGISLDPYLKGIRKVSPLGLDPSFKRFRKVYPLGLDKNSGFLDKFELKKETKSGIEINILKWSKL
ncbi:MAG: hypothetical protein COS29_00195 [Candidatus Omnitrophica bacterium CG02_land_8_20_14_3_00__42_8]|nr:MAG: hypothetical protein COS29_00195 [Candidatus Omnitrophica bacterium CG02_land_8_20_14_3_00__42_8]